MVGRSEYGEGAVRIRVAEPGGSSRIFRKHVCHVPPHGFRAIDDENPPPAHRLKIRGALNGTKLADPQHRRATGDSSRTGIRNDAQTSDAIEGSAGHVRRWRRQPSPRLGQALLYQPLWFGQQRTRWQVWHPAAGVVVYLFAICRLRKETRGTCRLAVP
jgi:hypothetical protein